LEFQVFTTNFIFIIEKGKIIVITGCKDLEIVMNFVKTKICKRIILTFLISIMVFTFTNDVNAKNLVTLVYEDENQAHALQVGQIDVFTISIPQLGGRQRNIQVYLPPGYDSSEKAYPVFYLFDGVNLFNSPAEAAGDYLIDETLDSLFEQGALEGVIVVGIEHDVNYEWSEYMPWVNENMHDWVSRRNSEAAEGGEGFAFTDFIVQTLKPEIDARYRTLTDAENTAIGGFCRMGLIPVVAAIEYPDTFGHVMAMSPAVWMAEGGGRWLSNNNFINYINSNPVPENVNFYADIGTDESSGNRPPVRDQEGTRITYPQAYVEGTEALVAALSRNGVPESNLRFRIIEGAAGTRDVWGQRFDEVVLWFYGEDNVDAQPTPTEPTTGSSADESPTAENNITEDEDQDNTIFLPSIQENENPEENAEENAGPSKKPIILISSVLLVVFFGLFLFLRK